MTKSLTLTEARAKNRLKNFVAQQEKLGMPAVDVREFDETLVGVIKPRQSKGRTSRSASSGSSTGKRTR